MASLSLSLSLSSLTHPMELAVLVFFLFSSSFCLSSATVPRRYSSIFSFGDSHTDTGNFLLTVAAARPRVGKLPYGMTYFGHPTGRCSDGRLVIDFIAEAFGLPLLPPYLAHGESFQRGANFAVLGATALEPAFFQARGVGGLATNYSLSTQIGWFEELKPSLCDTPRECDEYLSKSLIMLGEIGENDYNVPFLANKSMEEVRSYVPKVAEAIATAAERLLKGGAVHLVVPGNRPIGCISLHLTMFQSTNKEDYDSDGCLKRFNSLARHHNTLLRSALQELRPKYPQSRIIYFDYYGAAIQLIRSPKKFGFKDEALISCCGGGGPYNVNLTALCGQPGATVCKDPSSSLLWDDGHLTEAAYHSIAINMLEGPFTDPPINL